MLEKFGLNNKDFGASLFDAAQQNERKRVLDGLTGHVQYLMGAVESTQNLIEQHKRRLRIYRGRLDAIKKGEFEVNTRLISNGNPSGIVYNDSEYNTPDVT
jgi:hypothetical protein